MSTPQASEALHLFAHRLAPGRKCFLSFMGDSTCAQNTGSSTQGRWARGMIERWPVEWAQYVNWDFATSDREGNSSIYLPGTGIDPGSLLLDGVTTNPFCIGVVDQAQSSAGAHDVTYGRVLLNSLANYLGGDWTRSQSLLVRRLWTRGTGGNLAGCTQINANLSAGGSDGPGITAHNATLYGAAAARAAYDQTFTRGAGACDNIQLDVLNHGAVSGTACNYKTVWRAQNTVNGLGVSRGFGFSSISQGGWTTRSHLDLYSDAALTWEIEQCAINTIIIQLGINVAAGESSGNLPTQTFIDNYTAVVDKAHRCFDAANSAAGVPDKLVVCLSPWESGGGGGYQTAQSDLVRAIARAKRLAGHPTCFASMDSIIRNALGEGWHTSTGTTYLADGTHQTVAGALLFADLLWAECQRSLAANGARDGGRARGRRAA